jgi:predicted lipoprotein with Yx(FWY)xxD motif
MTTHREYRNTSVKRGLLVLVAAAGLAVTMAACGSDDKPTVASQPATTAATAATVPVTTTAAPKATVATTSNATFGTIMVDATGKTLYTFDNDTSAVSSCTGNCAATWPALVLPAGLTAPVAGTGITGLTVNARPDDATKMQVDWNGKPLYTYAADTDPTDPKGDGVNNGKWHVAKAS